MTESGNQKALTFLTKTSAIHPFKNIFEEPK